MQCIMQCGEVGDAGSKLCNACAVVHVQVVSMCAWLYVLQCQGVCLDQKGHAVNRGY